MKSRIKLTAYLLSLLLIVVEASALAHELGHQLQKPDAPCSQCFFVNHLDKTPAAIPLAFSAYTPETPLLSVAFPSPRQHERPGYAVRAPPLHSEI